MPGNPVTTVESVTIIRIEHQGAKDEALLKNAINSLKRYNFTSRNTIIRGRDDKSLLKTTLSKYYPSQHIKAEEYALIRDISNNSWSSVKQSLIALVQHAHNNTVKMVTGKRWSMELVPPNLDDGEYTPVKLPMLGFALSFSYTRDCDASPEECTPLIEE